MYKTVRPLLFSLSPEISHDLTIGLLAFAGATGLLKHVLPARVEDPVKLMGLQFSNRVGLAAGLDKNARCILGMQALGFGFLEVGTVTPRAQPGNPKPRMFRLPEQQAIINRMGFNNQGVEALVKRVKSCRASGFLNVPLGINIGKNKATSQSDAVQDYLVCMQAVAGFADYITVNLSSPNTPGLRDLQFGESLDHLLKAVAESRDRLSDNRGSALPLLVKIAPDMAKEDLLQVADRLVAFGIDGVIATNTTIDRSLVQDSPHCGEAGGLSGRVLMQASTQTVKILSEHVQKALVIIGVGGIASEQDALEKIDAGADLIQLYSGLIYEGPDLIPRTARFLRDAGIASQKNT